jgi:hypothetical protein
MQIVEQVGGTFLLQEMKPVVLHGALTVIISGPDKGWVLISLSPSDSDFSCETDAGGVSLRMGLDVALRFAGTLLVLASVHLSELREQQTAEVGELEIAGSPGKKVMKWVSAKGSPDIKLTVEEGNLEVRLRSSLATALAFRILRQAGHVSASPDQSAA